MPCSLTAATIGEVKILSPADGSDGRDRQEPGLPPWEVTAFFGQMSLDHTGTQACFVPCVTSPLPAKKSTKLGAGGIIRAFEKLEGGLSKGAFWGARGEG